MNKIFITFILLTIIFFTNTQFAREILIYADSISYDNEWNDTFDLLNRIEHFQLSLLDNKFNLFLGDINLDNELNILDVVSLVNIILN